MRIIPIVLDWRTAYMSTDAVVASLLTAPVGSGTLLGAVQDRYRGISGEAPIVASAYADLPPYRRAIEKAGPSVATITTLENLEDVVNGSHPGDWLLFVDPLCFPLEPIAQGPVLARLAHSGSAIHLVAISQNPGGMTDRIHYDRRGSVRGIHRFYDRRTWMFLSGVSATLLPASMFAAVRSELEISQSLSDFRRAIAACGVPARDVNIDSGTLDLRREAHLLRLSERAILESRQPLQADATSRLEPGARISGPVVIHRDAVISANATVIGPAVIGAGARIASGAVVAQCVIGEGVFVGPGVVVSHRAVFGSPDALGSPVHDFDDTAQTLALDEDGDVVQARIYPVIKMIIDRTAAAVGLAALSPLLLAVAALIKLDSRGPVFYAELRETIGGRLFRCWKFRTMRVGADAEQHLLAQRNQMDGPQFKINADPRITRVGRWLRKVSIDELPQLYNVLSGDMSLVGPRPSPFRENQICVPWRQARLSVRAGITGLWQVCRENRRSGDFHQWINYDVMYVRHLSFMVDVRILIATVITGGGAGRVPAAWVIRGLEAPVARRDLHERARVETTT